MSLGYGKGWYVVRKTKYHVYCISLCTKSIPEIFTLQNGLNVYKKTLNNCGFSEYWIYQSVPEKCWLARMVKNRLIDQFKQNWYNSVFELSKCLNFRIFKHIHGFEKYLTELPTDLRIALSKFRCVNHKLPIEKGRFVGIVRDDRICNLCNSA